LYNADNNNTNHGHDTDQRTSDHNADHNDDTNHGHDTDQPYYYT
jgi:hypothetical protein